MPTDLKGKIQHVVVLMFESRSFDMLGRLYPSGPAFDGLTGNKKNLWNGTAIPVWTSASLDSDAARLSAARPAL
jgi:phospholipase C